MRLVKLPPRNTASGGRIFTAQKATSTDLTPGTELLRLTQGAGPAAYYLRRRRKPTMHKGKVFVTEVTLPWRRVYP
jgi:hypothetical protein